MPLPAEHVVKAGYYIEDATGARVWCCNCPGTQPNRTLRFVAANRGMFSLTPEMAAKEPAPKAEG